jgi:hypothetical protein
VLLEYAGGDKLYLPVYRLHEIERYVAAEGKPPKLDKMGGTTFLVKAGRSSRRSGRWPRSCCRSTPSASRSRGSRTR